MSSRPSHSKHSNMQCTYKDWQAVVDADESDVRYRDAVAHVETCADCQARVETSFATDMPWWDEAKSSWLESDLPVTRIESSFPSVIVEVQSEMPPDAPIEYETVALNFLDLPSHPELLGRLGRYDIERVIGVGGMGIVLKAYDTELHRIVAIKILATHLANNASARRRFAREAQAAAAVLHPNVVPIYDVESDAKTPYLVMQCVNGQSLQSRVDRNGPISVNEALRIALQTASGLSAAHDQGLVHRDVKPANILLHDSVDRVSLSDFGLARAVDDASLTRTGVVAGTPHYMSPEQAHGDAIDTRSDQFSLGSVIYFMLTGRTPFRASTAMGVLHRICNDAHRPVRQLNSDVPIDVENLIDKLMAKDARQRFGSMREVVNELERLLTLLQSGRLAVMPSPRRNIDWLAQFSKHRLAWGCVGMLMVLMVTAIATSVRDQLANSGSNISKSHWVQSEVLALSNTDREWDASLARLQSELDSISERTQPWMPPSDATFFLDVQTIQYAIDELGIGLPKLESEEEYETKPLD